MWTGTDLKIYGKILTLTVEVNVDPYAYVIRLKIALFIRASK